MTLLGRYAADQEIYSIEESWLRLKGTPEDLAKVGRAIKNTIPQHTGLPVCVSIAPTKTLARFVNKLAKKNPQLQGVCNYDLLPPNTVDKIMGRVPITEIWGIAGRLANG